MLREYLKPFYNAMIIGLIIKAVGSLIELLLPFLLALIIDDVIPTQNVRWVLIYGVTMIVCALLAVTFNIYANRRASKVARDAIVTIRHDLFVKTSYLSCRQTDAYTIPSLESRLTTDTYNVHRMLGMMQRMGVRAPILLIGGLMIAFVMEPVLALVMLSVLPFITVLVYIKAAKGIPLYVLVQKAQDKMVSVVRENAQGIRIIKALSKSQYEAKRYEKTNQDLVDQETRVNIKMAVINPMMNLCMNLGLAVVIIVGAYRVDAGVSETGKIIAFTSYFTIISSAMMAMSRMFVMYSKGIASAHRIEEVLDIEDELEDTVSVAAKDTDIAVEFDHVDFSYSGTKNDLTDVTFTVKKGETLGIIGATGSGKSTIMQVLLRFYDVISGAVYVNGRDIRSYDSKVLRSGYGVVMQNDFIFQATIKENVAFGRDVDEPAVNRAIEVAQAKEFVDSFADGLEYRLTSKGTNLSGGQRQRIVLSRALADEPDILLLDDASSALDYGTDAQLRKAISTHHAKTTQIIVAQRISSIMHADQILVLEAGRVIASGTHSSLLEDCALYASINESQMGGLFVE